MTPHEISEFPHLVVNQARVLDYFAEFMANSPTRMSPDYGFEFRSLSVADEGEYPVTVTLLHTSGPNEGQERIVRAKYVVGADGARSKVRESIGCTLAGDQANHAWGVMDVLAVTDFPDIRLKCAIQSGYGGSILLIPREGGHLFRMYVDLGEVDPNDKGAVRSTTIEEIIGKANEILHPYTLDVRNVAWHSVYEVGHRLTDRFDDVLPEQRGTRTPRVFITGDACHTHSAKAGQGMNVSMQDGFNLAWKLGHVLEGRSPESLLSTYSAERQVVAKNLIDFDKEWSTLMAKKPEEFEDPSELEDFYVRTAEFPAGFMTEYAPSMLMAAAEPPGPGHRLHRRQALQVSARRPGGRYQPDAPRPPRHGGRPLAHLRLRRRRQAPARTARPPTEFAEWIANSPESPLAATPEGADPDAWFDVKVIYQQDHTEHRHRRRPASVQAAGRPVPAHGLRKGLRCGPDAGHLRTCAASTAAASWWSCARTSTWPTSCLSRQRPNSPRSLHPSCRTGSLRAVRPLALPDASTPMEVLVSKGA